jgi:coenzyme F420-reducing hydrogenase delta subunit
LQRGLATRFSRLRNYADGVLLTGCGEGDCFYRLGIRWTQQRIAGLRDPRLRARVPRERVATCWTGEAQRPCTARETRARVETTTCGTGNQQ